MRRLLVSALATLLALAAPASAEDVVKVGIIGPYSGLFASFGENFRRGVELYQKVNGDKAGARKVEFVYRDLPGVEPAKAKTLAQDLIVKDGVEYLGGLFFTPNALAVLPLLQQGKVPLVIFNAATSMLTKQNPLVVRTSYTMWQNVAPAAKLARQRNIEKMVTVVSDYAAGLDAEKAFKTTFEENGGTILETIRIPLGTTNFAPAIQRIKDANPQGVFVFVNGGAPAVGFVKAFDENGLKGAGIKFITTGDVTVETDLPAMGASALGIESTYSYAVSHKSPENEKFIAAYKAMFGSADALNMAAVAAYDGARVIYKMIEATGGKRDPAKAVDAVKDFAWESPRGPVKIDPQTRHIDQNIYIRTVEMQDGKPVNAETGMFSAQPDLGFDR